MRRLSWFRCPTILKNGTAKLSLLKKTVEHHVDEEEGEPVQEGQESANQRAGGLVGRTSPGGA